MSTRLVGLSFALGAALLAACAAHGSGGSGAANGNSYVLPSIGSSMSIVATVPKDTIGEELPSEGLGTIDDTFWSATLGGFTQEEFSQALGFPPGTTLTIENLSGQFEHTMNFVKKIKGPPANFPSNPKLSTMASGGKFGKGYASGAIMPGKTVKVKLGKAGIYLFGCAFHYREGMHDVLVIGKNATPGPQATKPAR